MWTGLKPLWRAVSKLCGYSDRIHWLRVASVDRATARFLERHRFESCWGFRFLSHACEMLIITSSQKVCGLTNIRICVNVDLYSKLTNEPKAQRLSMLIYKLTIHIRCYCKAETYCCSAILGIWLSPFISSSLLSTANLVLIQCLFCTLHYK